MGHMGRSGWVVGMLLLALVSSSAWSESKWQKLAEGQNVSLFINTTFIVKDGKFRRTLERQELKVPDKDGVRSRSYVNEYDCESLFYRISNVKSFSGPGLSGRVLFEVMDQGYWQKIAPNSLFAVGYVAACVE